MPTDQDLTTEIRERVTEAARQGTPLAITGGSTKFFLGREPQGSPLPVAGHGGVVHYDPQELVLTARAGTRLETLEALLAEHDQMLAFEPPHFGAAATLGGTLATNLSGPRRASAGAARDFVLGMRVVNGRGEVLRFGGEVMKNVAGYDLSRLMAGAMGTLGVILDASLKVLPRPHQEITLVQQADPAAAIERLCRWAATPAPVSASCIEDGTLHVRLSGTAGALAQARADIGGEVLDDATTYWTRVREQQHPFFESPGVLWRISLPPATPPLDLPGRQLIEWGGALRWLRSDADAEAIRAVAAGHGGHATRFRGPGHVEHPCHPLPDALGKLHRRIKHALDPERILNRGRMYPEL